MGRIRVQVGTATAEAEIVEGAPDLAAAFLGRLPLDQPLIPAQWSGSACWFECSGLPSADGLGNLVCSVYPGTLVATSNGRVVIAYGPAELRSSAGLEYGTRLARLVGNPTEVLAALAATHQKGDANISITLI